MRLVQDLATALDRVSDNGLTWSSHLKPGIKFEDGTTVTSQDVKYAVERSYAGSVLPNGPSYFNLHRWARAGLSRAAVRYPSGLTVAPNHRWSRTAGCNRIKEVTMTRQIRLWITAVLSIAATALVVGLTVTAQAGVNHAHTHPALAGLSFNGLD